MNERGLEESLWLLSRARRDGLWLRVLILVSPITGVGFTRLAADQTPAVIAIPVIAFSLLCVLIPDGHIGLLVVLLVATGWLTTVHDPATPWSIGVAGSLAIFHASLAAATVAAPAARWTPAMRRRWSRRSLTVIVAGAGAWTVVAAIDKYEIPSSDVLLAASLFALAIAGMWAREGTVAGKPADRD